MSALSPQQFRVAVKDFEDGVKDARSHNVDGIAYQINGEYRKGIDIAHQFMKSFEAMQHGVLNRPIDAKKITGAVSESDRYLGAV